MLKLAECSIYGPLKLHLDGKQAEINGFANYFDRVVRARFLWERKSVSIFREIRAVLEALSSGPRRCQYCEDSAADEVEHISPKAFYPELAFDWENYLFVCGPCNGSMKRDQLGVIDSAGVLAKVKRRRGDVPVPPPIGQGALIDPRSTDPTEYLALDFSTGLFVPIHPTGSVGCTRAEFTIEVLGLNSRDFLVRARRSAYRSYRDSLQVYVDRKLADAPADELKQRRQHLASCAHPTVWAEMKRVGASHPDLSILFIQAPEVMQV